MREMWSTTTKLQNFENGLIHFSLRPFPPQLRVLLHQ